MWLGKLDDAFGGHGYCPGSKTLDQLFQDGLLPTQQAWIDSIDVPELQIIKSHGVGTRFERPDLYTWNDMNEWKP